ncbi:MAG: hypothetical protein JXR37_11330 [Kiritimatiellae bacterium]|nr:hypothetical protein [Kiritimatiellia bacterium]
MANGEEKKRAERAPRITPEIENLMRSIGQVFSNMSLYGVAHSITRSSVDTTYELLGRVLEGVKRINISMSEGRILIDGIPLELRNSLLIMLAKRLNDLEISAFTLGHGMSREEFANLIDLLSVAPEQMREMGQFADVVAERGLQHVQAEKVMYQQVSEGTVVVDKDELAKKEVAAAAAPAIDQIVAFLKGDVSADGDKAAAGLQNVASDADKLAELIMESAAVRQKDPNIGEGESLANIVVGCLRRTFQGLTKNPSARTQKGRKAVKKTLFLLEKELLDKLRSFSQHGEDAEADRLIAQAMEEMQEEMEIDTLAADYMKKRKAAEQVEDRVRRFIKNRGETRLAETELEAKLRDGGLTPDGWRELVVKSGAAPAAGMGGGAGPGGQDPAAGFGMLAALLSRLEEKIESAAKAPGETSSQAAFNSAVAQVSDEVSSVTEKTAQKIDRLSEQVQKSVDDAPPDMAELDKGTGQQMSRRLLFATLSEIVQELRQPLSVVNASVGMIAKRQLGEVSVSQQEMLNLAANSGERIEHLIDKLAEISGMPDTVHPDQRIVKNLYEKE